MSNDKMSIRIDEQVPSAPTAVQADYQAYIAALQQSQDYREKLTLYQDNIDSAQNSSYADDLVEAVSKVVNMTSNTVSSLANYLYYGETVAAASSTPVPEKK